MFISINRLNHTPSGCLLLNYPFKPPLSGWLISSYYLLFKHYYCLFNKLKSMKRVPLFSFSSQIHSSYLLFNYLSNIPPLVASSYRIPSYLGTPEIFSREASWITESHFFNESLWTTFKIQLLKIPHPPFLLSLINTRKSRRVE